MKQITYLRPLAWLAPLTLLGGCKAVVLSPSGYVAEQQRDMLVTATLLMLIIIIPVMFLVGWFAWRYRASNTKSDYRPNWDHSTKLELAIWGIPVLIIVALGAVTWVGTHLTDPYRPLERISENVPVTDQEPLDIDVVALDWKWLFIYPEQGIASVNELAVPVDQPVRFHLTASTVMNAFYIPAMVGMIYAMPGMETTLNGVLNEEGTFEGKASHYSGAGFSGMHFKTYSMKPEAFDQWIAEARAGEGHLGRSEYLDLAKPTENVAPRTWAGVDPQLYDRIVNMCVEDGKICMAEMMALDASGGTGLAGTTNVTAPKEARANGKGKTAFGNEPFLVTGFCTPEELAKMFGVKPAWTLATRGDPSPLMGKGLTQPVSPLSREWGSKITDLLPPPSADATNL